MKTMVYWVGVILLELSIWGIFVVLWIFTPRSPWKPAIYSGPIFLIVGIIIFTAIGWRMMKEGEMT